MMGRLARDLADVVLVTDENRKPLTHKVPFSDSRLILQIVSPSVSWLRHFASCRACAKQKTSIAGVASPILRPRLTCFPPIC